MTHRKSIILILCTLLSSIYSSSASAYEFKNFKIIDEAISNRMTNQLGQRSSRNSIGIHNIETKPEIIERVNQIIGKDYNQIGDEQSAPLILNHNIGGGVLNFSGFTWNKPQGNIKIFANRELAPDIYSDSYLVHDKLTIFIDANTYLTDLRDANLIDISDVNLAAFIGLGFKRIYHYYHLENDYVQGLKSDYSKLFNVFNRFNLQGALNLAPYEILKREDLFYFNAGGFVSTPPVNGVSASAGVLVDIAFKSELNLQALGQADKADSSEESLRVSSSKSWNIAAATHLSLQLDFFNLLKIFLIQGELEYEYGKGHKQSLSFYKDDLKLAQDSALHKKELNQILKGKQKEIQLWRNNIVQIETREHQNIRSRYSILFFGSIKKKETEQVKVIKDGVETVFYRNFSQSTRYIQNILSKLFNLVIVKVFNFDTGVKNFAESSTKMKVEYKKVDDQESETALSDEEFSLSLSKKFSAGKTHRWIDKRIRRNAVKNILRWSNLEKKIAKMVANKRIRGPLSFESKIEIETSGLRYFHSLGENEVFAALVKVCRSKRGRSWLNPKRRKKMLRRIQLGRSACVKRLGKQYLRYKSNLDKTGKRDLKKFKSFMGRLFSKARGISHLQRLFGPENVFIYGSLIAKTKRKENFSTYFKTGQFRGLGVIDSFIKDEGITVPVK